MIDKKKVEDLATDIDDVLRNVELVRGPAFAMAVAGYFESRQMLEILAMLTCCTDSEGTGRAAAMDVAKAGTMILSSMTRKITGHLNKSEALEVVKIGDSLFDRRMRVAKDLI
jgi:hypothetical protein